jgi:hypothetical protein
MATSEIEKLERRYAENPHGLTFAPLAEVHRKNGDVARALELLTAGLELHPNYIPASIVLGRCHQDLGDQPSAEAAFAHVLKLDDENVIALKSLADINERLERFGEAETWLRRLISVDRSNDEAREQLLRIEAAKQGKAEEAAAAGEPKPDADSEQAPATPVLEMIDLAAEPAAKTPEPAPASAQLLPAEMAELRREALEEPPPKDDLVAQAVTSDEVTPTPPVPTAPVAEAAETQEPAPEPIPTQEEEVKPLSGLISAEFQPPLEAIGGLGVETSDEVVLEVSGDSEFRVPDASADLQALVARLNQRAEPEPVQPSPEPAPVIEEPAPQPSAELEFIVPPTRQSYVARDTNGQSVAAFFHALLAARPPSEPGAADRERAPSADGAMRQPQDAAAPSSALDADSKPVPPAVPSGEPKPDAAVSFDDFFGSEGDGSTASRRGSAEPGEDDLDQFQSWLQNLKR